MKNKSTKYFTGALCAALFLMWFSSCDTDYEPLNLQPAYEYTEKYYENLRAYKSTMFERSLCFVWFSDYSDPSTPAYRFSGLPDSVDVCSLWGGYPEEGTVAYE